MIYWPQTPNRTLTAKFKEAITSVTINIHDVIWSGANGGSSRTEVTRLVTSSASSAILSTSGEEYSYTSRTYSSIRKDFYKDQPSTWDDENVEIDVYGDQGGDSGFSIRWKSYSLIVDGITVINNKAEYGITSETIRINNIDYIIIYTRS